MKCPSVWLWWNQTVMGTLSKARTRRGPDVELSRASKEMSKTSKSIARPCSASVRLRYTAHELQVYGQTSKYIETVAYL
ncbi:hypothetical protein POSPLADRAFT_1155879 [Postia placenta MAD-698-R-SB12]|uniref:Uncharacterized protein n=1 Tax=Postia placenta MAD-698-R-SB12 TaxID=670580 RepID=A0A1X6MML5_9APHY|nr:hypothetical protein POSPLADRAFT_1155879 [Postia placenta MAD-698-R-SB12]OSX57654.1 hypothetical protein POSPLADRAFT_1155879 [Postia placenta MAD-698-R-SB12]